MAINHRCVAKEHTRKYMYLRHYLFSPVMSSNMYSWTQGRIINFASIGGLACSTQHWADWLKMLSMFDYCLHENSCGYLQEDTSDTTLSPLDRFWYALHICSRGYWLFVIAMESVFELLSWICIALRWAYSFLEKHWNPDVTLLLFLAMVFMYSLQW